MKEIGWLTPALLLVLMLLGPVAEVSAWGNSDSVLLKDIEVLTLHAGRMTNGKRSSPVQQLECVKGGTAPCDAFRPRVVQCYNRGWDGVDVQWECKTDMDNEFRFGQVEVSCEGYSNRDDPYVLKGSCGLRYSLDYTKEGYERNQGNQHNYYPNQNYHTGKQDYGWSYQNNKNDKLSSASFFANLIVYAAFALMCYAFYKTCIGSRRNVGQDAYSTTDGDYPAGGGGGGGGYGWFGGNNRPTAPPPPGFRPEYTDDASCHRNRTGNTGGGGFWTGAAAGGLLGYMFGNRGQNNYGHRAGGWGNTGWGNSGWGNSGWGGGGGGFTASAGGRGGGGGGGSSGTRTASGFGGTSRR